MNKGVHYRLINQNTLSALDEVLALANFDDIINNDNINEATQFSFDRINNDFRLSCPIRTKTLSPKNTTKPWISAEICANIKKQQNYYSLVRQNKMSHQFYLRFRNFVTNQIRQGKINYFARKFQQFKGDCRSTWKQINSINRPNRINKKKVINKICENDITYVTKHDISNVLNSYFVNTLLLLLFWSPLSKARRE